MLALLFAYVVLVAVDTLWLTVIAQPLFQKYLGSLLTRHALTIPSALLAWLILLLGVKVFVMPLCRTGSMLTMYAYGAFFGLCIYGVYELTNFAVIRGWMLPVVFFDTLWGAVLCGALTLLLHWLGE